jgi:hypothetical protein
MKNLICVLVCLMVVCISNVVSADTWRVPKDFATIQEAMDSSEVVDGDTIRVGRGNHAGAYVTKAVEIEGQRWGRTTINSGPMHPAGLSMGFRLLAGSDGATISHLTFIVDLAVMNGAAVNDVSVTQCIFLNAIQAVSQWGGSGWEISHNQIVGLRTKSGGGIGVLIADSSGGTMQDNVVSHNNIYGTLYVDPDDCGDYDGSGIALYADFRWGRLGTAQMSFNRVFKNKVRLVSDNPEVVDVNAFELTDTRDDENAVPYPVIFDNEICFNDWRGTESQMLFTPEGLEDYNKILKNFGKHRGRRPHPGHFGKNFGKHRGRKIHPGIFGPRGR